MGIAISCPGAAYDSINDSLEAVLNRSIGLGDNVRSTLQSIGFNGRDYCLPAILEAFGLAKSLIKGSFHLEPKISTKSPALEPDNSTKSDDLEGLKFTSLVKRSRESTSIRPDNPKHEAAVKLQKVYKSFRTRRQLADCAVLVEQHWWKLLDFALLKQSSVSFFDIEKPESAMSRWSRATIRAAKVGKGLSKDENAQKLALQHWLEAIDPRHRYGHNLQFYYDRWLQCDSMQPFFYWLDVGEGKEVNLEERCTRSKLQQQCIKYLGPKEREAYEVIVEDGKFMYRQSRQLLDTSNGQKDAKWIFVLSTSKKLYVGQKRKGKFQHSSFLAGGATSAAGRLVVEDGVLKAVWPHSGHYRPTEENFQELMSFLEENSVDLTDVKRSPTEEDDEPCSSLKNSHSELNLAERNVSMETEHRVDLSRLSRGTTTDMASDTSSFEAFKEVNLGCSLADLKLGGEDKSESSIDMQLHHKFRKQIIAEDNEESEDEVHENSTSSDNSKKHYMFQKSNLFLEEQEEDEEAFVPSESILRRMNTKKAIRSYQLGKQLSFKWTTGAGPRIGCVRDYPSELQFRALEQVNLSPRIPEMFRFASPCILKCPTTQEASVLKVLQQQPHKPGNGR
ncbi:IQ domain-containing protein IQM2-like [Musa acuminata AAA Group]|uniref:IQ domain-containing protein IQM2-like n=1 Tax=Musa acuminata AAA Group TaxID=214697 RepID=UPI0031D09179